MQTIIGILLYPFSYSPLILRIQIIKKQLNHGTNDEVKFLIIQNTPSACSNGAPASTPRKNVKVRRPNINTIIIKGHLKGVPEGPK